MDGRCVSSYALGSTALGLPDRDFAYSDQNKLRVANFVRLSRTHDDPKRLERPFIDSGADFVSGKHGCPRGLWPLDDSAIITRRAVGMQAPLRRANGHAVRFRRTQPTPRLVESDRQATPGVMSMPPVIQVTQVYYPESDGKPMGETDEHRDAMVRHIELLKRRYRGQRVYVSGDLLVYTEQGNPKKFVVPDAFVVKDTSPRKRRVYKLWVEGKPPDVVIETTSRKTRRKDLGTKPELYARIGVREYFIFDPDQEYLDPPLQGYRRVRRSFVPMEPDAKGGLISKQLGLRLVIEGGDLEFYDLESGQRLLTGEEEAALAREQAREARQQANEARQQTDEAHQQTRAAERRAAEAEAEIARLREQLARQAAKPSD
jgi:Uma2 family endonuclease